MIILSASLRDLLLDGFDVAFPAGSMLELQDVGGRVLAVYELPADAWAPSSDGSKVIREPWEFHATGSGLVTQYVLRNEAHEERGTVSEVGGGGDAAIDNTEVIPGTLLIVSSFTKVA